jgi:hypothetical protein
MSMQTDNSARSAMWPAVAVGLVLWGITAAAFLLFIIK